MSYLQRHLIIFIKTLNKMKFKLLFFNLILILTSFTISAQSISRNNSEQNSTPDRIMLSIPGNPASSRAVTWRTKNSGEKAVGQIAEATSSPFFAENVTSVEGTSTFWQNNDSTAMGHKVIFNNLTPETMYMYRVGNGTIWSEWLQFRTSSNTDKPFNFIYLGDFQNDIKSLCSRTIRQAYSHFPNADFMLFAGDLVSRSTEDYWSEFFYAGDWIYGTMPSLATPGNHEYTQETETGPRVFSRHWNQIFVNPQNGPENLKNQSFYIDYQGVRFISLNSPALGYSEENAVNSTNWLQKVLSDNPNQWTILFTHYPVYSCSQGRNNERYRSALKPILEKYGVDLVLQGHDHTYCRGQNLNGIGVDCKNPPMYMVSVSGPKMYGLNVNKWSDRVASQTQLYQNIVVNDDTIFVQAFTVTGELYDEFSLIKNKNGFNKVVESKNLNSYNEFIEIPESARGRYTEEELNLYKKKFQ